MNAEEFKNIIYPMKDKLFRFAKSIIKQPEEARDITQDILVKLWNTRHSLQQCRNIEAFAMKSIKNLCLDKLKHEQVRRNNLETYKKEQPVTFEQENMEKEENRKMVRKAIEKLPVQQKMIIHLRDIEEMSYEEIQAILQMDIQTIRMNVSRGRKKVREEILKQMSYEV